MSDTKVSLIIRLSNGSKVNINIDNNKTLEQITVYELKEYISKLNETLYLPIINQRIIYKGRILSDDNNTLSHYGIVNNSTIFLVKSSTSTVSATPKSTVPTNSSGNGNTNTSSGSTATLQPSTTTNSSNNPFNSTPGTGNTQEPFRFPFPNMGGGVTGSDNNTNPLSAFGGGFGDMMGGLNAGGGGAGGYMDTSTILNNPMVQSMLDANPDFLRTMMRQQLESNPALQQLMNSNPSIRHMLNDPNQFDEMIRMMRNPAAMQQAMRSQDLALSQIENMPGGFAALTNMYETMQRPIEEGFDEARSSNDNNNNNNTSINGNEGATGAAMPNPWGSPTPQPTNSNINPFMGGNMGPNNAQPSNTNNSAPNPSIPNMFGSGNTMDPFSMMMGGGSGGAIPNMNGLGGSGGGLPSSEQRHAAFNMLQNNPAMTSMLQQAIRSNPSMFRQMLQQQTGNDPRANMMFQNMTDEQFAEALIQVSNPENVNRIMQMEQQLGGLNFGNGSGGANNVNPAFPPFNPNAAFPTFNPNLAFPTLNPNAAFPAFNPNAALPTFNPWQTINNAVPPTSFQGNAPSLDFSSLLQGGIQPNAFNGSVQNNTNTNVSPADRYRVQLRSLYDMGFDDEIRNVTALESVNGNLNRAVDALLSGDIPVSTNVSNNNIISSTTSTSTPVDNIPAPNDASSTPPPDTNPNTTTDNEVPQPPKDNTEKKND